MRGLASKVQQAAAQQAPGQAPGSALPPQQGWGGPQQGWGNAPPQGSGGGFYPQVGGGRPQPQQSAYPPVQGGYPQPGGPPQNPQWSAPPPQYATSQQQQYVQPQVPQQDTNSLVATKINQIIQVNRLQAFYPPDKVRLVLQRLALVDFRALAVRWRMNLELALDLSALALYDIVIFADDSYSMIAVEDGERIDDLKMILEKVSEVATLFDDDGISLRAINSSKCGDGIKTAAQAAAYVQGLKFRNGTALGTELEAKVIKPFVIKPIKGFMQSLKKPVLVVVITDGEPTGEPKWKIRDVIKSAKRITSGSKYGENAIAFQFAQVGKDTAAQDFLGQLDNDPEVGGMIDATSYYELEEEEYRKRGVALTPELWLVKLLLGGVDPSYDEQDE